MNHRLTQQSARSPGPRRGMTGVMLIEVLVSILIFSFGILGTVALYSRAVQYSTNAEDRNRASLLANEIATVMWTSGTVSLNADILEDWDDRVADVTGPGLPGGIGTVTVAVVGTTATATITVTWTPTFSTIAQSLVTQVTL